MITITKEFNFTANDFFNYLDKQLIYSIKKSRNNDMPVKLVSGIRYQQDDIETVITTYKRGEAYEASFKNSRMDVFISYHTQDTENGVKITFSEEKLKTMIQLVMASSITGSIMFSSSMAPRKN